MANTARRFGGKKTTAKNVHVRTGERARKNANARGYTWRWRKAAFQYLNEHPLCVQCDREGGCESATCVDHVIPHRGDDRLFWDESNWAPMCKRHHDMKTARGE